MSDPIVLSASEMRTKLVHIARHSMDTVLIERDGIPVAVYRPLTESEERAQIENLTLPLVSLTDVTMRFGKTRKRLAEEGGQAIVSRVAPGWYGSNKEHGLEELLGVLSLLTPNQINQLRQRTVDPNKVHQFSQIRKAQKTA